MARHYRLGTTIYYVFRKRLEDKECEKCGQPVEVYQWDVGQFQIASVQAWGDEKYLYRGERGEVAESDDVFKTEKEALAECARLN